MAIPRGAERLGSDNPLDSVPFVVLHISSIIDRPGENLHGQPVAGCVCLHLHPPFWDVLCGTRGCWLGAPDAARQLSRSVLSAVHQRNLAAVCASRDSFLYPVPFGKGREFRGVVRKGGYWQRRAVAVRGRTEENAKQEGKNTGKMGHLKWEMRDEMTCASTPGLWIAPWQL